LHIHGPKNAATLSQPPRARFLKIATGYLFLIIIYACLGNTMTLKEQITEDMKTAMRAKETQRLGTIRLLLAALKQREVDERITLTDADVMAIVEKEIKKRRDSISQYRAVAREDLATQEEFELGVLQAYLPAQADEAEVLTIIAKVIADTGAKSPADMGKVMGPVKAALAGRADMAKVSQLIKAKLTP
jgi:uncharacterized protein